MWNCPNCKQTIPELLTVKEDIDIARQNLDIFNEYCVQVEEYNAKKQEFERKVKKHNENRKFYQDKCFLDENWLFLLIKQEGLFSWRKTIEIITIPHKPEVVKYRYIQCPMCGHKEYIH